MHYIDLSINKDKSAANRLHITHQLLLIKDGFVEGGGRRSVLVRLADDINSTEREILSRFCSTRILPTHEPFGAMPSARTPFHAGVERAESAQGDSVTTGAWQGLTHYVSGPVCVRMCAL